MKFVHAAALVAALMLTGTSQATAAEPAENAAAEVAENAKHIHRERAEQAQTEAAEQAVESVLSATRLDLDIRLIGPTSVAGEL